MEKWNLHEVKICIQIYFREYGFVNGFAFVTQIHFDAPNTASFNSNDIITLPFCLSNSQEPP